MLTYQRPIGMRQRRPSSPNRSSTPRAERVDEDVGGPDQGQECRNGVGIL